MTSIPKLVNTFLDQKKFAALDSRALPIIFIVVASLCIRFLCIGSYNLLVEEAYYWNYSQHLDFGYLDHPPMVALLIKLSTLIFGTTELAIRFPALLCWGLATWFSYQLSELICRDSGLYAVLLLAILPFYFLQSLVTTPDQPVLVCWSAALYYFYRIARYEEAYSWYKAGIWLGLGLLSKYTIVLLGPCVVLYLITVPSARHWFIRKEPYLCALIAALCFTPVIYWNATHEWASFVFQSTRRFQAPHHFSFHYFLGLLVLFLLPGGIIGLKQLIFKNTRNSIEITLESRRFIQIFTLFPLAFFGLYSFNHSIKIDWVGPGLISIIPWLALLILKNKNFFKAWYASSFVLIPCYMILIGLIAFGPSQNTSQLLFKKMISWENLTEQFTEIANKVELDTKTTPIFVPLDAYNIGSELLFYQSKLFKQNRITKTYPVVGSHLFNLNSLMYQYWDNNQQHSGSTMILISTNPAEFELSSIQTASVAVSEPQKLWAHSQGKGAPVDQYYYKIVTMK